MLAFILHRPWATYASGALIFATGGLFALLCMLIIMVEAVVKLIAIPVVFFFGMSVLMAGLIKRKFGHIQKLVR